jgi:anti-anti-sigma regulatory factor
MLQINLLHPHAEPSIAVLALHGDLDSSSYNDLVAKSMELYQSGMHCVLLDLSDLNHMGSAGLAAVNSLARLMRGESPHDMEMGWSVFHQIKFDSQSGLIPDLKIYNPQPKVAATLNSTGIDRMIEIYRDYTEAVSSFTCHDPEVQAV